MACAVVALCLIVFAVETWRWPMVGDAVSVHYLVLLMQHGMTPYRQIVDAQMPGTYLVDWLVVHVFGGGRVGLRVFDFSLIAGLIVGMTAIAWPLRGAPGDGFFRDRRLAAWTAGGVFALAHGRDGIEQAGQRDLVMAVLLIAAYAFCFHAMRARRPVLLGLSSFCAVLAVTMKPTVLPAAFFLLAYAAVMVMKAGERVRAFCAAALAGGAVPVIAVVVFLIANGSVPAFLDAVAGMWPYYATLQRRPLGTLLTHSISPVQTLVGLWLVLVWFKLCRWFVRRRALFVRPEHGLAPAWEMGEWEHVGLVGGMVLSLFSFLAQGKGFVYHRYPFLAFLLLVLMLDFQDACCMRAKADDAGARLRAPSAGVRVAGYAGLIAACFLAPICTWKIVHFDWRNDEYYDQLSSDLDRLGGTQLSGRVQCMDAFSGCIGTLYHMGLVQSTGFLVDFYFFQPQPNAVVDGMRQHFWQDLQRNPPRVFVVSKQVFPVTFTPTGEPLDSFDKLQRWPAFDDYLRAHYSLQAEHHWTRPVLWSGHAAYPADYRIYVRKD